jgi:excisionase family DNA binding protein
LSRERIDKADRLKYIYRMAIENMYTASEVAEKLRVKKVTVHKWICEGRITAIKGRPVLISESAIKEYLRKRTKRAIT